MNATFSNNVTNTTVSTAKSIFVPNSSRRAMAPETIVEISLHFVIFMLGTIGNSLVVIVIIRSKSMRCATNWLVFNLAMSDLGITLINIPLNNIYHFTGWPFGEIMCKYFLGGFGECIVGVSVLTHTALALTRYHVVLNPMRCNIKLRRVRIGIIVIWLLAYLFLSAPLTGMFKLMFSRVIKDFVCRPAWPSLEYKLVYRACVFAITYAIPMIMATFCYVKIFKTLNHSMNFLRNGSAANPNQMKRREYRSKRLTKALFILYTIFAVTTLPLEVFYLLIDSRAIRINSYSAHIWSMLVVTFYSLSIVNPVMLFYMSEEYRSQLSSLFGLSKCCTAKERKNRSLQRGNKGGKQASSHTNNCPLSTTRKDSRKQRISKKTETDEQEMRPLQAIYVDDARGNDAKVKQQKEETVDAPQNTSRTD
eukprot:Seg509.6 transcript_id=Seg509.6/GoldUCD/mRNA.D3Y31 product="Neuropeptide FF receptor 2" protein_id=Seg509.6/GoldUCD/D3Y31